MTLCWCAKNDPSSPCPANPVYPAPEPQQPAQLPVVAAAAAAGAAPQREEAAQGLSAHMELQVGPAGAEEEPELKRAAGTELDGGSGEAADWFGEDGVAVDDQPEEELVEDDLYGEHFELSEAMIRILEQSAIRELLKQERREQELSEYQASANKEAEDVKKAREEWAMKMYGESCQAIMELERSLDAQFNRVYESFKPRPPLWPTEAINPKAY